MKYTASAHRRERYWWVQCDQLPGAISTVSRLDQAVEHQREAIAFVADLDEQDVEVEILPVIPEQLHEELKRAEQLAHQAAETEERAREMRRHVARQLAQSGLTVRDVGQILGVSYQRAHQLVKS